MWLLGNAIKLQPKHYRYVWPGPCVLRPRFFSFYYQIVDRDKTVSRRFKPSSRTTLFGEQPNPWNLLQAPGCDEPTSRCQTIPSIGALKNH